MAAPIIKLEEQLSDLRSNQVAYKLTIENLGAEPIILLGLEPSIPVGAQLLEVTGNEFAGDFSETHRTNLGKSQTLLQLVKS
ncbi:hypothetical protein D3C77_657580 [compost metagenome]